MIDQESVRSDLSLRLEPMLQRMAVPTALRYIELIGALGNPGLPINPLDRPWLAIWVSGWQPHKVVTAAD